MRSSDGFYRVRGVGQSAEQAAHFYFRGGVANGFSFAEWRALGMIVERVVILTPQQFNKQMQDAHNIGQYGAIECRLQDLLEEVEDTGNGADIPAVP